MTDSPVLPAVAWASLRLAPMAVAVWVTGLALLGSSVAVASAVAVVSAIACVAVWVAGRGRTWRAAAAALLVCTAGEAAAVGFRLQAVASSPVTRLAAERAEDSFEAVLTGDPSPRTGPVRGSPGDAMTVPARVELMKLTGQPIQVRARVLLLTSGPGWRRLLPSQRVRAAGRFVAPSRSGDLLTAVVLVDEAPRVLSEPSVLQRAAGAVRSGLSEATDSLPGTARGLLPGLVLGDTSRLEPQLAADLRDAGLSHLTAVSGANLAIVAGAVLALARWAGVPLAFRAVLTALAMVTFAVMARPSPSVLRALVMGLIAVTALATGRKRDGMAALAAAAVGLLLVDPGLARSYGFALSVLATAGIMLLAPRWRDQLGRVMPRRLAEAVAIPAAAQAACAPVLVMISGQLDVLAVPANLLAAPAVGPATVFGFAAALASVLSSTVATWLVLPGGLAASWIAQVATATSSLAYATLPWPRGVTGTLLLLGAGVLIFSVWWWGGFAWLRERPWRAWAVATVATLTAVIVAVTVVTGARSGGAGQPWPPRGWLLVACDVGQGDALAIAAGEEAAIVVDTGADARVVDRCLRKLRVRKIPLLVLTHPHADHIAGLSGVLRRRSVGAALVSSGQAERLEPETAKTVALLRRRRVPMWTGEAGQGWRISGVEVSVLGPTTHGQPAHPLSDDDADLNDASVVLWVRWGRASALLTGDVEIEAQAELVARGLPRVDLLKVAHHGSAKQDPAFLAAVGARVAFISVGAENDYGHPSPSTLSRLAQLGIRTYRTDRSGDLALVATAGGLAVVESGRRRGRGTWHPP